MAGSGTLRALCLYFVYTVRTAIHLAWIGLSRWLVKVKESGLQQHKIVIVGDGIAAGVGDYVPLGTAAGIAGYLEHYARRDPKIRQKWQVVNCGKTATGSHDWLPGGELFESVFGKGQITADAEVVMVIAGGNDGSDRAAQPRDAATTAANLVAICDPLRRAGKRVALAPVHAPSRTKEACAWAVETNRRLLEYCTATSGDGSGGAKVCFGPALDSPRCWQEKMLCWDGMHFGEKAYTLLAKETLQLLRDDLVKVEWRCFQALLSADGYAPPTLDSLHDVLPPTAGKGKGKDHSKKKNE